MLYLNENDLIKTGVNWKNLIDVIEKTVHCFNSNDFSQPMKPYLRYKNLKNRIIAMPAYVGGKINTAGIKWIASFPDNINCGIPRAHSIVILNNADTGEPLAVINTALLSILRTASVSGLILKYFDIARKPEKLNVGIIGWGPIGQYHFKMCNALLGDKISQINLYDKRPVIDLENIDPKYREKTVIENNWTNVFKKSDVFITCTVSDSRYIDLKPKNGSLILNTSLRDFKPDFYEFVKNSIIVDHWEEVCRENTDIELMHKNKGLRKEDTKSMVDVVCNQCLNNYAIEETIMFNPMGMSSFDVAIGAFFMEQAIEKNIGLQLI